MGLGQRDTEPYRTLGKCASQPKHESKVVTVFAVLQSFFSIMELAAY